MHYFKMNIGDYAKKAGRLSMLEHGAYTLLIHACYDRERFPTMEEAFDWCWVRTEEEKQAVEFVLNKFFTLEGDIYVQSRIQEEIDKYHENAQTNKRIATEREENRRKKTRTVHEPCLSVNEPPPNQEPLTNKPINQDKEKIIKKESSQISRPEQVNEQIWNDFLVLRKQKKAPVTQTAINGIERESIKAGITLSEAIEICCQNGWQGFKAEWLHKPQAPPSSQNKNHKFSAFDYLKGGDGYGNKREQETRIIDIDGEVVNEDEKRTISYRAPI
ncbi:MAG: YdaU family protein [Nitrosomonas sp.]|nr:YdaU family protein [Nitrosomonas sp.]